MKNFAMLSLSVGLALAAASFAGAKEKISNEERNLERISSAINKDAARPGGRERVEARLKSEFKVDDAQLQRLRERKLGYGEMAAALCMAQRMPGGITDSNINRIMSERMGPPAMGWGQIAKREGVPLGGVLAPMRRLDEAGRTERAELRKREQLRERERAGEKTERQERSERSERIERQDRSERPENPKR